MKKLAGVLILAAVSAAAQTGSQGVKGTPSLGEEKHGKAPDDAQHQGITVHGHWILNVRDANGKVVEHRDFENSVVTTGQTVLTSLLIGAVTPGYFNVAAYGNQDTATGPHFDAQIYEVTFPQFNHCNYASDEVCTSNLTVTPVLTNDPSYSSGVQYYSGISLQGSFKAAGAVVLSQVGTSVLMCRGAVGAVGTGPVATRSTYAPTACPAHVLQSIYSAGNSGDGSAQVFRLTGTSIAPLSLAAGQTLDLTVVLSFS